MDMHKTQNPKSRPKARLISCAGSVLFSFVALATLTSCGNSVGTNRNSSVPSGGGGGGVVAPATSTNFQVTQSWSSGSPTTYLHNASSTDFTSGCSVSPTETVTSNKNITCYLEVAEQDLFMNTVNLNWTAPPGMCNYVETVPYWFYQYQPGDGSGTTFDYTVNADTTITINTNPGNKMAVHAPNGTDAIYCAYDYTWLNGGPNCCEGIYTATVHTVSATGTTTTVVTSAWSGKYGNCAQGPATDSVNSVPRDKDHNVPGAVEYYAYAGLSSAITVTSNITKGPFWTAVWSANYLAGGTNPGALNGVTIGSSTYFTPSKYYTVTCYDTGREALAQINVAIRRWTMASELAKLNSGNPNAGGTETITPGAPNDDTWNWDDWITYFGTQSAPNNTPAATYPGHYL